MGEGLAYISADPTIKRLLCLLVACMVFAFPFIVSLMAYYARNVVHASAGEMGRIMSTSGLGAMLGSTVLVVVGPRAWKLRIAAGLVAITIGITGLGFSLTPLAATLSVGSVSIGTSLYLGTITQVVQQRVPNHVRGRVMAVFMMGMTGVMPLSSVVLSALADSVGFAPVLLACGALFGLTTTAIALTLPRDPTPLAAPP
jgi:MFS family permease